MSLDPALCLSEFDTDAGQAFRLGIVGFDDRARAYHARARSAGARRTRALDVIIFITPTSAQWAEAKAALRSFTNLSLCQSSVTAIFPSPEASGDEAQFLIETALGSYPVDDIFFSTSGGALSIEA